MPTDKIIVNPPLNIVRAQLRQAGGDFPKRLQQTNKEVAKDVADEGRAEYKRTYTQRSGEGAKSIRALATQTKAQVAIGGAKAPYGPGQNFGSNKLKKFAPKATPDRFLYATVDKRREEIEKQHGEMVDDLMDEAFPKDSLLPSLGEVMNGG
jgi:hypothetical protein